jgi:exopolyphosphatase / guanosine-5'-triphosphate,3'-diphosphate pyrophosphatase
VTNHSTIAAVDLGSNSFRLQLARVSGRQIYPLDSLKDSVRLGAGLSSDKRLDEESQERALACLSKFGERLRGLPKDAVRAVGTNTLRVAKNAPEFLKKAQRLLGFPIEIVAGHEEARLIYLGVAHALPTMKGRNLVVDIGGGSTEVIIGAGFEPQRLESLYMGCVSHSKNFFGDGKLSAKRFAEAELAAGTELQTITGSFAKERWQQAVGSSGTARAIAEMLLQNGWAHSGINAAGLSKLRKAMIKAGEVRKLDLPGLSSERKPVIAGGLAIMTAVFDALAIEHMSTTDSGMREGVLWDMLGRMQHHDVREATVAEFMRRYHVDRAQAARVERLALLLYRQLAGKDATDAAVAALLAWSARLHEIGLSIAYSGYHRHSAYILEHADMPGFARGEQASMAHIVLGQRGAIAKAATKLAEEAEWLPVLALRLAVLFFRGRSDYRVPRIELARRGHRFELAVDQAWLARNQLLTAALKAESKAWRSTGFALDLEPLVVRAAVGA